MPAIKNPIPPVALVAYEVVVGEWKDLVHHLRLMTGQTVDVRYGRPGDYPHFALRGRLDRVHIRRRETDEELCLSFEGPECPLVVRRRDVVGHQIGLGYVGFGSPTFYLTVAHHTRLDLDVWDLA